MAPRNMSICSHKGCAKQVQKGGGVCTTHGATKKRCRCSVKGCTTGVVRGGMCITHSSTKKRCSFKECTNFIQKGGVCWTQGANAMVRK